MAIELVVTADDFGCTQAIDEGILEAQRDGIVTAASLFVTFPDMLAGSVPRLAAVPTLSPGLHVDLTWGPAAWPERLRAQTAGVTSFGALWRRVLTGRLPLAWIEEAVSAQFDAYLRTGLPLRHVDTHQHILGVTPVFRAVARCCAERGVEFLRVPREAPWGLKERPVRRFLRRRLAAGKRYGRRLPVAGTVCTGQWSADRLAAVIARLPENTCTELICHPARPERTPSPVVDRLRDRRPAELAALCAAPPREALARRHVTLRGF